MADDAIKIEVSGNVKGDVAKRIRDIGTAALEADSALDILKASLNQFSAVAAFKAASNDVREFRNEVNRATQTQKTFDSTISGVTAELTRGGKAVDVYRNKLKQLDDTNINLRKTTGLVQTGVSNLFGLLASGFALTQYAQAQDAMTGIQNKIRSVTQSSEELATVQTKLLDIANRTRSGYEATTDGFVRFAKSMRDVPQDEVLRFVETLNKSLVSAGRTTGEVNSIVVQLGQALTSGRLMGDEFRSLSENLPYEALQAIADVLDVDVAALKGLSTQGLITTEVLREAFANMATDIDATFGKTVPTISQALTVLNNQFIAFTDSSSAGAGVVSSAIMLIADNLNIIIPLVAAFAAAWALVQLVKIATEMVGLATAALQVGAAFIAANAVTILWVAIIATLVVGLVALGYILAELTGTTEQFENAIVTSIKGIQGMVAGLFSMGAEVAGTSKASKELNTVMQNMQKSLGGATSETKALTGAANDNKSAVKSWSSSVVRDVNAVSDAYRRLTSVAKEALAASNAKSYASLAAQPGGTQGSFTAVPAAPKAGSPNSSITTIGTPRSSPSSVSLGSAANNNRSNSGPSTNVSVTNISMNVSTPDANSFNRSRNQIASDTFAALG